MTDPKNTTTRTALTELTASNECGLDGERA